MLIRIIYKKTNPQQKLFGVDTQFSHRLCNRLESSWAHLFKTKVLPVLFRNEDRYDNGRPWPFSKMIVFAKSAADPTGHYSRPDVTRLLLNPNPLPRVQMMETPIGYAAAGHIVEEEEETSEEG